MAGMSNLDPNLISRIEHEGDYKAKRVYIAGGADINVTIDTDKLSESLKEAVMDIKIPEPSVTIPEIKVPEIDVKMPENQISVVEVEKVITIPEVKIVEIEKPTIVKETVVETIEIEKPVYIKEVEVVEVDKPVITEKIIEKIPAWVYSIFVVQFLLLVGACYKLFKLMGY